MKIAENTGVPACMVLVAKGNGSNREGWLARKEADWFVGSRSLELLGLVAMAEYRGANWRAADREIDDFFKKYFPVA